jgi:hypothetical protein
MNLQEWAERQFKVVEQDGACVAAVKLVTAHDNEVWETWTAPFPPAEEWAVGAETFLRSLENEWPNRGVSVCFIATTAQGEVLSKLPRKVQGKNKQGGGPWNTDQAAVSMAMDNVALTIEKLQRLVNTQLDSARRISESNAVTIYQQTELIKLMRQNAAIAESESGQPDALTKLVSEHGADFLELAKLAIKASSGSKPKITNGVHAPKTKE